MVSGNPVSRRERPAKPGLSREGIVRAAVGLMRAEGMERVTMRRLAQALDTGPASLYVYVRDTSELHAAVLDELLGDVVGSPQPCPDPRAALHEVLQAYRTVLVANPGPARVALVTRPHGPHYLALIERVLALLAAVGVPDDRAAWLVDVLLLVATASAAEHSTRGGSPNAEADDDALAAALAGVSAESHPRIAALGAEQLLSGPGPLRGRWFVDVLVNGAAETPRP
jgi:AcrR family transcriptional regulator